MGEEFGGLLILGIVTSSTFYLISACAAVALAIIPVIVLFVRRDPLFLFLFPIGIYIFGPLLSSLTLQWTPFSIYVFPENALEQTWLITYAVWLSIIVGTWTGLSRKLSDCLCAPLWEELSGLAIFRITAVLFAAAFIVLESIVFRTYGASVITGSYTGYTADGGGSYTDPVRTAAGGAFYGVMLCAYIIVLGKRSGKIDFLLKVLSGVCCIMMLLSGARLQFIQIAVTLAFFFFWKRSIGLMTFAAMGLGLLSMLFLVSIGRGSNGAGTLSVLGVFLPVGEEAALNALSYNISYSVAGVKAFNFSDIFTFISSTLLFGVPGFFLRILNIPTGVTDIQVPILSSYMRYIANFSPVGGFSLFGTVGYVFKSFFWPITFCIPFAMILLRLVPGRVLGNAVLLAAILTSLSFWRDPFTLWWKTFLQNILSIIFLMAAANLLSTLSAIKVKSPDGDNLLQTGIENEL